MYTKQKNDDNRIFVKKVWNNKLDIKENVKTLIRSLNSHIENKMTRATFVLKKICRVLENSSSWNSFSAVLR